MKNTIRLLHKADGTLEKITDSKVFGETNYQNVLIVLSEQDENAVLYGIFGKHATLQGEERLLNGDKVYMKADGVERYQGVEYNKWYRPIPTQVLQQLVSGKGHDMGVQIEAFDASEYETETGVKFWGLYETEEDLPTNPEEGDLARVFDTASDWLYDEGEWVDTEERVAFLASQGRSDLLKYPVIGSYVTDAPTVDISNVELILQEMTSFLRKDGTRQLTGEWDIGNNNIVNINKLNDRKLSDIYEKIDDAVTFQAEGLEKIEKNEDNIEYLQANRIHRDGTIRMIDDFNVGGNKVKEVFSVEFGGDEKSQLVNVQDDSFQINSDNPVSIKAGKLYLDNNVEVSALLDVKNNRIVAVGNPDDDKDAANKKYVDDKVGQLEGGAFVYRGEIDETTETVSGDKTLLDSRIETIEGRSPETGDVLKDNEDMAWLYNGTEWKKFFKFGFNISDYLINKIDHNINMKGNKVEGLSEPTQADEATRKSYIDQWVDQDVREDSTPKFDTVQAQMIQGVDTNGVPLNFGIDFTSELEVPVIAFNQKTYFMDEIRVGDNATFNYDVDIEGKLKLGDIDDLAAYLDQLKSIYGWEDSDLGSYTNPTTFDYSLIEEYDFILASWFENETTPIESYTVYFKPEDLVLGKCVRTRIQTQPVRIGCLSHTTQDTIEVGVVDNNNDVDTELDAHVRLTGVKMEKEDISEEYAAGVIETNKDINTQFWTGTQDEYDAIETYDDNTLYIIKEE